MRSPLPFFLPLYVLSAAFLGIGLRPALCDDPKKPPAYNYGSGGTPNQIQARAIGVDRSPMSSVLQLNARNSLDAKQLATEFIVLSKNVNDLTLKKRVISKAQELKHSLQSEAPFYEVLAVTLEERSSGSQRTTVPEFTFGDVKTGIDVGFAPFVSGEIGDAAVIKFDFTPSRSLYVSALKAYARKQPRYTAALQHSSPSNDLLSVVTDANKLLKSQLLDTSLPAKLRNSAKNLVLAAEVPARDNSELRTSLIRYNRDLQEAIFVGAHWIDHAGWFTVQGITASKLVPFNGTNGLAGVTFSVIAQAVEFDDTEGTHYGRSDGQLGGSIALQDKTDYYGYKDEVDSSGNIVSRFGPVIHPWTWKLGGEYYGRNSLAPHESVAVFARIRELRTPYHFEFSPYYGKDALRKQYFGFTVGMTFPLR